MYLTGTDRISGHSIKGPDPILIGCGEDQLLLSGWCVDEWFGVPLFFCVEGLGP